MNKPILNKFRKLRQKGKKSLAVLIDPDKMGKSASLEKLIRIGRENYLDFFFVGGSFITTQHLNPVVESIKNLSDIPVILFPGSSVHIDPGADAILFLSLISGRNPELLIGQHVVAAPILKNSKLEVMPTGYLLISSDRHTSVAYMSNSTPIPGDKYNIASSTALAGQMLGMQLIYIDSGSGGMPISVKMIGKIRKAIDLPLIVGGGIDTAGKAIDAFDAGADVVVIGNAIEKNPDLLIEVSEKIYDRNNSLNIH